MRRNEKHLLEHYRALPEAERVTLLAFAEFLAGRVRPGDGPLLEPLLIPRPEQESVVRAIKRLTATYPMLDHSRLLNETSDLMSRHVLHGEPAAKVIDRLEALFAGHYAQAKGAQGSLPGP